MKSLLSIQDAATFLKVHPETLRRWDNDGKLKAVKVGERGDRWYKQEDLLKIKFGTLPEKHKDYTIMPYNQGFEISPGTLMRIASFIVSKDNLIAGFSFNDGGMLLHMANPHLKDEDMLEEAIKIIKERIDQNRVQNLEEYTFSYYSNNYLEDKDAKWWTKSLKRIYGSELKA